MRGSFQTYTTPGRDPPGHPCGAGAPLTRPLPPPVPLQVSLFPDAAPGRGKGLSPEPAAALLQPPTPGPVGTHPFSPGPVGTTLFSCSSSHSQAFIWAKCFATCKTTGASCGRLGWDLGTLAPLQPSAVPTRYPTAPGHYWETGRLTRPGTGKRWTPPYPGENVLPRHASARGRWATGAR